MSRREQRVTITAEGRDKGKVFVLTEMPASQAERWAARAFLSLARGGTEIPGTLATSGMEGIARLGLLMVGRMQFSDAQELMDEMFTCIRFQPDPAKPDRVRDLAEDDIEEVATRLQLRKDVFALHVDFSKAASLFGQAQAAQQLQA